MLDCSKEDAERAKYAKLSDQHPISKVFMEFRLCVKSMSIPEVIGYIKCKVVQDMSNYNWKYYTPMKCSESK